MKCSFDQEDIRLMATALDGAWNYLWCRESRLSRPDRAKSTRLMLATRIVAAAVDGERRHGELLMSALRGIANSSDFEPQVAMQHGVARVARGEQDLEIRSLL
jgi:hypothetical protein